jgi:hypothetical protein
VKTLPPKPYRPPIPSRNSAAGRGSRGSALTGTVRAVQAMGMQKKQQTEGEWERSPEQEYLSVNWQSEQDEASSYICSNDRG